MLRLVLGCAINCDQKERKFNISIVDFGWLNRMEKVY